jgi:hypothetical protein
VGLDVEELPAVAEDRVSPVPRSPRHGDMALVVAAMASVGAGTIHAAAIGIHAEHPQLARIFIATALLQVVAGVAGLVRPDRRAGVTALGLAAVNGAAGVGWLVTRVAGISWIDGLEVRESPQLADTIAAVLAGVAVLGALAAVRGLRSSRVLGASRPGAITSPTRLLIPAVLVSALAVAAMVKVSGHDHAGHATDAAAPFANWPRPWDPSRPIDVAGVAGVTAEQEARATKLIGDSLADLPRYADTAAAIANGYASIGDAASGSEHYIKSSLIQDSVMLDAAQPESLVYTVDGEKRTLAGAMYITSARPTDDPSLLDYAGPLMQWHNHGNLCFSVDANGSPIVVGLTRADGTCAAGINFGRNFPMVHVWITPHPCGVFAALEGVGAGQAAVPDADRVDMCTTHSHA